MTPRYISKQMQSPYFNSSHYKETTEHALEVKIGKAAHNIFWTILHTPRRLYKKLVSIIKT